MSIKQFLMPHGGSYWRDSLSGITVALALVPEAIAFALVAGVSPFVGLYAAFFMCFITALIGGRPGMISGATGATAVVMASLVHLYGVQMLFACVMLAGVIQIAAGLLGFGKFIRMMPKPVMVGFVNGLAIVIFIAQFAQFKRVDGSGVSTWMQGADLYAMVALVLIAMAITYFLPKFTRKIPGALAAIIVVSLIVPSLNASGFHIPIVNDMMHGALNQGFPSFALPKVAWNLTTLKIILPTALVLSVIGLSESLMTLSLIDERTASRGRVSQECLAQGTANLVSGLFSSMGGCAMIGQSMINISSGGRGRLSGLVAGLGLLLFILFAWPLIKLIPLAALVGVMFMVVIGTFDWSTFSMIRKIPRQDALIIMVVTLVTVTTNLAIAVFVGVVLASLFFAWETAKTIQTENNMNGDDEKIYSLRGLVFFASVSQFKAIFDANVDPSRVVLDLRQAKLCDHSAVDAIKDLIKTYAEKGKEIQLLHMNEGCRQLLTKVMPQA